MASSSTTIKRDGLILLTRLTHPNQID